MCWTRYIPEICISEINRKEKRMKGYYLFAPVEDGCVGPDSGVERKVRAQYKALSEYTDCELVILPAVEYSGSAKEKIVRRLPFTAAWRKWEYKGEFDDADFVYIRQVYHDDAFVRYLHDLKRANPNIKIIYEVPTYPYDSEKSISISSLPFVIKERSCRLKAAKYFDRVVTFYGQKEIWGVPCIRVMNGYDFSKVELPNREKTDAVELISVSITAPWHGYDRLINGIHNYYENGGTENIVYHLVGNILPEHKRLVNDYQLQEHVILHGKMFGDELKELYKKSFLGVDILAGKRRGSLVSSTLKSREYAAYGLPIMTGAPVDYLPEDYKYQMLVEDSDEAIDIKTVLEFYHGIYDGKDCDAVANEIREYAIERCDMSIAMKPVADWIMEGK